MNEANNFKELILEEIGLLLELNLTNEKIQIFSKDDYEENQQLRHYNLYDKSILIVPTSLMDNVIQVIKKDTYNNENLLEFLIKALNLKNHRMTDETAFLFLDPNNFSATALDSLYEISEVEEDMTDTFEVFTKECSPEDLEEGLVSLDDSLVFGCFKKNKLVGAASYWFLTDHLVDIGVIVHPDYRKKGIAKALVSRLSQWGIEQGKYNMYRHDRKNKNSRKVALAVGFKEYVNLEVIKEIK